MYSLETLMLATVAGDSVASCMVAFSEVVRTGHNTISFLQTIPHNNSRCVHVCIHHNKKLIFAVSLKY